ncbi:hypothetical protein BJ138DRAFT_1150397 [Hygrophoropsis aurantiaca]|uniref:Uncharacterized protein n=1 Tax=Hygrophoropsis aurantiaca TaxID=72124 RepID=A0ACB8AG41_9AGAM|nr:hypothetical protein BJ138DRAFT_1150397 [Hygrophoropsis aurantiaca]
MRTSKLSLLSSASSSTMSVSVSVSSPPPAAVSVGYVIDVTLSLLLLSESLSGSSLSVSSSVSSALLSPSMATAAVRVVSLIDAALLSFRGSGAIVWRDPPGSCSVVLRSVWPDGLVPLGLPMASATERQDSEARSVLPRSLCLGALESLTLVTGEPLSGSTSPSCWDSPWFCWTLPLSPCPDALVSMVLPVEAFVCTPGSGFTGAWYPLEPGSVLSLFSCVNTLEPEGLACAVYGGGATEFG